MNTTAYQNHLMQHTCGLSNNENRNFFGTSLNCKDSDEFEKLVAAGLANKLKAPAWSGDDVIYSLTDEGKRVAAEAMPKPKKLTRSQQNYQNYLKADCCETFAEYMGFKTA